MGLHMSCARLCQPHQFALNRLEVADPGGDVVDLRFGSFQNFRARGLLMLAQVEKLLDLIE